MPVSKFTPIPSALPDVDPTLICWEQKYLYDVCLAISTRVFPMALSARSSGELNQARFVTTAYKICRVYAATSRPPAALKH